MSLDRSLRTSGNLAQQRSVKTRAERITQLHETSGYDPKKTKVLHLRKTDTRVKKA